jgi:hypothetical protein
VVSHVRDAGARGSSGVSPDLGTRSDARIGILADCDRTLRSAHRQAAFRADCRRWHSERAGGSAPGRTRGGAVRRPADAGDSRRIEALPRQARSATRRRCARHRSSPQHHHSRA